MKTNVSQIKSVIVAGSLALFSLTCGLGAPAANRLVLDSTPPIREGALGGYSAIVDKVAPSVVSVYSSSRMSAQQEGGLGSGVIISSDGYIVTNRHVISNADEVKVTVGEGSAPYDATIIGMDEATDVAVLKIDATGLQPVKFGDSSLLKAGDFALAIGSPFGLRHTVTTGIISALERSDLGLIGDYGYENFIQTDASINPGNSGGALVDNRGRMIGINTAIYSRTGSNVGIGFAIPSDLVVGVAQQLIDHGEVRRGFLGVLLGNDSLGSIIQKVIEDSPALAAGLRPGDVVTKYDGKSVTSASRLRLLVASTRPGSAVDFQILRDEKTKTLTGTIGDQSSSRRVSAYVPRALPSTGR
jgi:serine protease Do